MVIAVMSPKGGIGKTTTACSIACLLGQMGRRTLLVDADPQGDASRTYGAYDPEGRGLAELLERRAAAAEVIHGTSYENVDIITANGYLMRTDMRLQAAAGGQIDRFREAIRGTDYAYIICDCGRLLDLVVMNVLLAGDLIIAPVKTGGYEVEALQNLQEQVEELKELNPALKIKVLMTMRQKNRTSEDVETWLREMSGFEVFKTAIRRSVVAEKSSMACVPLPIFARRSIAAQDYQKMAEELVNR